MFKKEEIIKFIDDFLAAQNITVRKLNIDNFIAYSMEHNVICALLLFLKNSQNLRFNILSDLFAADFPGREKRFEVVYSLLSLELNQRILIKTYTDAEELIPSISHLFSAACWYEREAFDMFGIQFEGCPDMRRILTDYGFIGHPLRKDFPLTGYLEVKYDEKMEQIIHKPVELVQEFRMFDFLSPWQGPKYILPGDEKATK